MKKILLWSAYLVVVLLLVMGGVNRTTSKLGINLNLSGLSPEPNSQPVEHSSGSSSGSVRELLTREGVVINISQRALSLEMSPGGTFLLERRPWRFALESGFTVQVGDRIQLLGFYEGEYFEITALTNLANGQSIKLRDETGHPLWSSTE